MLNKRIILIVAIVLVVVVAVLLSPKQQEVVSGDPPGDAHGLLAFKDPGLVLYYTDVVLVECPYLQPNAAQYSSCVLTMREMMEKSSGITESEKEAFDAYCSLGASLSADDYTMGYADLYNICILYQASKNTIDGQTSDTSEITVEELSQEIQGLEQKIHTLGCDVSRGFFAEREYTYPILRKLGYNPDNYGIGINNPLINDVKYSKYCVAN